MALLAPQYGQAGTPITTPAPSNLKLYSGSGTGAGTGLLNQGGNPNDINFPSDFLSHPQDIVGMAKNLKTQQDDFLGANQLSSSNLLPGQRNFSDQTQNEISQYGAHAGNAGKEYVDTGMEGANEAGQLLNDSTQEQARQKTAMGGPQDPALTTALERNNSNNFQNTLSKLKSSLEFQAPTYQAQKQTQYAQYLGQNEQNKNANYQQQVAYQNQQKQLFQQWKQAQDQASTGAIGAILGGVGTVVGAVGGAIAGGPAGAAAGAAAGGALGNAAAKI